MRRIFILSLTLLWGCPPPTPQVCVSQEVAQAEVAGTIADNVVVVLDDSGSMDERMRSDRSVTKMEAAKKALTTVLEQLQPDAHVGVVLLNGTREGTWLIPLGPVDPSMKAVIANIEASGGTPLGERIKEGADMLLKKRDKARYGSYRLLVVTDGEANDEGLVDTYLPDILSRGVTVDVIGVDMAGEHSLATKVHNYRKADDPASLEAAIKETFAETADDDATADEDYILAAALPDEMAIAVLASLTNSGNHPIGEVPQVALDEEGNIALDEQGNPQMQPAGMGAGTIVLIVVGVIVALIVVALFFKAICDC